MAYHSSSQARLRPRKPTASGDRDSNCIRASVLDAALQLGIADSPTVANWIFNSPLDDTPEESEQEPEVEAEEVMTPTLASGSTTTSDDSDVLNSPKNSADAAHYVISPGSFEDSTPSPPRRIHFGFLSKAPIVVPSSPTQKQSNGPGRIFRSHKDGYESDGGGSVSESRKQEKNRKEQVDRSLDSKLKNEIIVGPSRRFVHDGGYDSDGGTTPGRLAKKLQKRSKLHVDASPYETDKEKDYFSDGGYLSSPSKKSPKSKTKAKGRSFFRRRASNQHGSDGEEDNEKVPPLPTPPSRSLMSRLTASPTSSRSKRPQASSTKGLSANLGAIPQVELPIANMHASFPSALGLQPHSPNVGASPFGSRAPSPVPHAISSPEHKHIPAPLNLSQSNAGTKGSPRSKTPTPSPPPSAATSYVMVSRPNSDSSNSPVCPVANKATTFSISRPTATPAPRLQHLGVPPPTPPPNAPLPSLPPSPASTRPPPPSRPIPQPPPIASNAPIGMYSRSPSALINNPSPTQMEGQRGRVSPFPMRPAMAHAESDSVPSRSPTFHKVLGVRPQGRMDENGFGRRYMSDAPRPDMRYLSDDYNNQALDMNAYQIHALRKQRSNVDLGPRPFGPTGSQTRNIYVAQDDPQDDDIIELGSVLAASSSSTHLPSTSYREPSPSRQAPVRPSFVVTSTSKFREHLSSSVMSFPLSDFPSPRNADTMSSNSSYRTHDSYASSYIRVDRAEDRRNEVEYDEDASFYPSDEKTAGRRTMYMVEHEGQFEYDAFNLGPQGSSSAGVPGDV